MLIAMVVGIGCQLFALRFPPHSSLFFILSGHPAGWQLCLKWPMRLLVGSKWVGEMEKPGRLPPSFHLRWLPRQQPCCLCGSSRLWHPSRFWKVPHSPSTIQTRAVSKTIQRCFVSEVERAKSSCCRVSGFPYQPNFTWKSSFSICLI